MSFVSIPYITLRSVLSLYGYLRVCFELASRFFWRETESLAVWKIFMQLQNNYLFSMNIYYSVYITVCLYSKTGSIIRQYSNIVLFKILGNNYLLSKYKFLYARNVNKICWIWDELLFDLRTDGILLIYVNRL